MKKNKQTTKMIIKRKNLYVIVLFHLRSYISSKDDYIFTHKKNEDGTSNHTICMTLTYIHLYYIYYSISLLLNCLVYIKSDLILVYIKSDLILVYIKSDLIN